VSLDGVARRLEAALRGRVERDFPLAGLTTYRLGGPAALYVEPAGAEDLETLGRALRQAGLRPGDLPTLALGRGSNLVISDRGWPGLVIRLGSAFSWIRGEDGDEPQACLAAGASTPLPQLANWAARRGLAGVEFTIAIPGSVGGAVRMNAGAHGSEIGDRLLSARIVDLDELRLQERGRSALRFSYRRSALREREVVVDATLELRREDAATVRERMEGFRRHRAETQPGAAQNAGSVFVNPPGDAAGRLVEAAGLKGFSIGGASVSELHANFFIAAQDATAQDVYDLVHAVQARVRDRFGVGLVPEVRFAGPFEARAGGSGR
jgi:UDP-N-acetylmuramate dehydrogenase